MSSPSSVLKLYVAIVLSYSCCKADNFIIILPPVTDNETVIPVVCCDIDAPLPVCPVGVGVSRISLGCLRVPSLLYWINEISS